MSLYSSDGTERVHDINIYYAYMRCRVVCGFYSSLLLLLLLFLFVVYGKVKVHRDFLRRMYTKKPAKKFNPNDHNARIFERKT